MRTPLPVVARGFATLALAFLVPGTALIAQRGGGGGRGATNPSTTRLPALPADPAQTRFEDGRIAWEDGDFPAALRAFDALLASPDANRFLVPIAQITGTAWETTELTADGAPNANPTLIWSPSGKLFAFEEGVVMRTGKSVIARKTPDGFARVREIDGVVEAISPDDRFAIVQLTTVSPELQAARDSIGRMVIATNQSPTTPQTQAINAQAAVLTQILNRSRTLSRLDLTTGVASPIDLGGRRFIDARVAPDGRLLVVAASPNDSSDVAVWRIDPTAPTFERLTPPGIAPARIVDVAADGTLIVAPTGAGGGGRGGRGGGGRGAGGGGPAAPAMWIVRGGVVTPIAGISPSVSRSVNAVAYVVRAADSARVELRNLSQPDSAIVLWRGPSSLNPANPAMSPDGRRVAFELMPREDREVYVAEAGAPLLKVTHDIPHDRSPVWRDADYLIALQGEPRHTQTFGYDLRTLARDRLFHNNTIRTIAPQYAIAVAPDGRGMLIASEADGNTISPERGVYLLDFDRPITVAALRARVKRQLDEEVALRARSRELFATLMMPVRAVTERVSVSRIHDYLDTLTSWGSRHISQPGNRKAIDYLARTLRSWGYDVELQEFTPNNTSTANVVATLRGTAQADAVYVVSSHLDSVAGGPGADDNGSGTSTLLEVARVMKNHPQPATIQFAFFTGEESGLLGAREFVRRFVADSVNVVGALNNDMIGFSNDHRLDNTIRYSSAGIRDVQYAASLLFTRLTLYSAKYYRSTDAQAYTDVLGEVVGGIGSYPVLSSPHYHQSSDVMETINFPQLAETGKATVGAIMYMASSPSPVKSLKVSPAGQGATVTWAPSIERDVARYQVRYTNRAGAVTTSTTTTTSLALPSLQPGSEIAVRAVNRAGRFGWEWARGVAPR